MLAMFVIWTFWRRLSMNGSRFSHRAAMGIDAKSNMRMVRRRVRESRVMFLEPNAWLQSGSMPMARPDRTE